MDYGYDFSSWSSETTLIWFVDFYQGICFKQGECGEYRLEVTDSMGAFSCKKGIVTKTSTEILIGTNALSIGSDLVLM